MNNKLQYWIEFILQNIFSDKNLQPRVTLRRNLLGQVAFHVAQIACVDPFLLNGEIFKIWLATWVIQNDSKIIANQFYGKLSAMLLHYLLLV
jgi:hypothetical protein